MISILGLISGVYGAYSNQPTVVVVTGITGAIAAALSMAAGSLLSAEAERDILLAEINKSRETIEEEPYLAQESLQKELVKTGMDEQEAFKAVKLFSEQEDALFKNFKSLVLKLPPLEEQNPYVNAIVMFFAFILGSLFPILPFIITEGQPAFIGALVATSIALFTVGGLKGYLSDESVLKSGTKFFLIAFAAGVISEFIGSFVGLFFPKVQA